MVTNVYQISQIYLPALIGSIERSFRVMNTILTKLMGLKQAETLAQPSKGLHRSTRGADPRLHRQGY